MAECGVDAPRERRKWRHGNWEHGTVYAGLDANLYPQKYVCFPVVSIVCCCESDVVSTVLLVSIVVPYQDNSCDCGVFVCRYAYGMYRLRAMPFTYEAVTPAEGADTTGISFEGIITNNPAFDFNRKDVSRIRKEIMSLIEGLSNIYTRWKLVEQNDHDQSSLSPEELCSHGDSASGIQMSGPVTVPRSTMEAVESTPNTGNEEPEATTATFKPMAPSEAEPAIRDGYHDMVIEQVQRKNETELTLGCDSDASMEIDDPDVADI
jgi:hypothetical protein